MRCDLCPKQNTGWSWSCFQEDICNLNDADLGDCDVVENGMSASRAFVFFEGVAFLFNFMILERILAFMFRYSFGVQYMVYALATLKVVMHIIAFAAWNAIMDPKYSSDCDDLTYQNEDSTEVCALTGPELAIGNIVVSLIAAAYFIFVFCKRDMSQDEVKLGIAEDSYGCVTYRIWYMIFVGLFLV